MRDRQAHTEASNETDDGPEAAEAAVPGSNPDSKSEDSAPQQQQKSGGRKRGHRKDKRDRKPRPDDKSQAAKPDESSSSTDKTEKSGKPEEVPVQYVDAPIPKTNPWIKNLPPAPSAQEQVTWKP